MCTTLSLKDLFLWLEIAHTQHSIHTHIYKIRSIFFSLWFPAEVSDVANAVLDGADCVMLTSETARGKFPIEAVTVLSRICREAEHTSYYEGHFADMMALLPPNIPTPDAIALAAAAAAAEMSCAAIVTTTK